MSDSLIGTTWRSRRDPQWVITIVAISTLPTVPSPRYAAVSARGGARHYLGQDRLLANFIQLTADRAA